MFDCERGGAGTSAGVEMHLTASQRVGVAPASPLASVASFATGKLLQTMLFGVSPHDPMVLSGVGAVLVALAAVASWPPARRALRVDPMKSLRTE